MQEMLVVGKIPQDGQLPLEVVFRGEDTEEALHLLVSPGLEYVQRWAFTSNTTLGMVGRPGDGTTIDMDEPFILR
jgi:hypothetical protein